MMAENVARVFTHRVIRTQLPASSLADGHQGRFWFRGWAQSESAGGRGWCGVKAGPCQGGVLCV